MKKGSMKQRKTDQKSIFRNCSIFFDSGSIFIDKDITESAIVKNFTSFKLNSSSL